METARHFYAPESRSTTARHCATVKMSVLLILLVVVAGCGQAPEQSQDTGATSPASAAVQALEIAFQSQPNPPKTGENAFQVSVTDHNGQPLTDADVSVEFYMAAMPAMNMPEMRNSIALQHDAGGRYRGTGNVMMAGAWDVTVSVKRAGTQIGNRKFNVTAQ